MLYLLIFVVVKINYFNIKSEPPLPSYERDVGEFKPGEDINNELTRWYINNKTAECETFQYRGIKGNFNNFRTKIECKRHLENPISDKINGCQDTPRKVGSCSDTNTEKWSWDPSKAVCESFKYTGCGGNRNRYDTQEECKIFCYNEEYGIPNNGASLSNNDDKEKYAIPSYYDCHLRPDLQKREAEIKAMALIEEKQCVYVAAGLSASGKKLRGAFDTINDCIKKCFPNEHDKTVTDINDKMKQKIPACSRVQPDQFEKEGSDSSIKPTIRFYYDHSNRGCSRFESWPGTFDKDKNNFPSAEICESYCGWEKPVEVDAIEREPVCYLSKAGEYSVNDNINGNLNVKRWYFDSSEEKFKCRSFLFGGLNGNANNFKSFEACKIICWAQMDPDETLFEKEDQYNGTNDDQSPT